MVTPTSTLLSQTKTEVRDPSLPVPGRRPDIELVLPDCWEMSDQVFEQLVALNDDIRIEWTANGSLLIAGSPSFRSTNIGGVIARWLGNWAEANGGNGDIADLDVRLKQGIRRPDAGWFSAEQAAAIAEMSHDLLDHPLDLVPAVIVEVRSPGQAVADQQTKMQEWMANGVRLGWLVDPIGQDVFIYRPGLAMECRHRPEMLSGEDVMAGFEMSCEGFWR